MERLVEILHRGCHSLVVKTTEGIKTFDGRGISDLYSLWPNGLRGAEVADKVVGKGAAALMILGRVSRLHADIISQPALDLLKGTSVEVEYDQLVTNIINRKGDGICPVERLCADCGTAEKCLPLITQFIESR